MSHKDDVEYCILCTFSAEERSDNNENLNRRLFGLNLQIYIQEWSSDRGNFKITSTKTSEFTYLNSVLLCRTLYL